MDYPSTTKTLGAAKITGRLPSGTSIGLLAALSTAEVARTFDVPSATLDHVRVGPWTSYGVGRVQQEFGPAGSTMAVMGTVLHRYFTGGDALDSFLPRSAFSISGDSLLRFKGGEYEIGMNMGVSHVAGEAPAIARVQRSSARYLQRPDRQRASYNPSRTSLTGVTAGVNAERTSGRHWLWRTGIAFVSPEFEVNDLGRLSTADDIAVSGEIEYRETEPGRLFRQYSLSVDTERRWNYEAELQQDRLSSEMGVTWNNFWSTELGIDVDLPSLNQRLTRGGPSMATPRGWSASLEVSNRDAATTRGDLRVEYGRTQDAGLAFEINGDISLQPTPRWQLSFGPGYERQVDDQQYVTTLDGGPDTFGQRFVFAFVDRTTIASEIRLKYAFTPDLNLEFYGEPFAASGRYYAFGELAAPNSRARRVYGTQGTDASVEPDGSLIVTDGANRFVLANRDFHLVSFHSNLVLRWEWRSGSTLYVVWQQDRNESEGRPDRVGLRDLFRSFQSRGSSVFAVKATFWLGVSR